MRKKTGVENQQTLIIDYISSFQVGDPSGFVWFTHVSTILM